MRTNLLLCFICVVALVGCGGESGSSSSPVAPTGPVVFIGDSITYNWGPVGAHGPTIANPTLDQLVPGSIDTGIPSQTSAQMLTRFQTDVLDHHPSVVVILAGTNDLRDGGPVDISNTEEMAHEAQVTGARVILGTLLSLPGLESSVDAWNSQLAGLAQADGYTLVDYHAALVPQGELLTEDFLSDGIHPNQQGYVALWTVLAPALKAAWESEK